jgi:nucleotide-binding universal stress UspA family protein
MCCTPRLALTDNSSIRESAASVLTRAVEQPLDPDGPVEVSQTVLEGNPAAVLLGAAVGAELLVVGSCGLGGFAEALLGSVSRACVHHSHCPVFIVRGPQAD